MCADFAQVLHAAGLVVEHVQADGQLHRCGTTGKPRGQDGAYKAFLDTPASVWWKNWRTGEEGTWSATPDKELSAAERTALRERVQAARKAAAEEQAARWAKAASQAAAIWQAALPAGDDHPYLARKRVPSINLRLTEDGRLLVPVLDATGKIQSLQFILPVKPAEGPDKRFLSGGRTAGGWFLLPARQDSKDGPLLIAEGYATAASLHLATGYACLVAFNAGNLEAVARLARKQYPEREIILCADNDIRAGSNPGVEAATRAAQAVGGKLAVCPAIAGGKADFNDLATATPDGLERVRQVVEAARGQAARATLPAGYFYDRKDGALMYEKRDGKGDVVGTFKVCAHVEVVGRTYGAGKWGVLLEWKDRRGDLRRLSIPSRLFQQQGTVWAEMLADEGLDIEAGQQTAFKRFILALKDCRLIRNVAAVGWFDTCFVLPDETIGTGREEVVLQVVGEGIRDLYQTGGSLTGWQDMACLCAGNSRFEFALSLGFAAPLLAFANMDGSIFNLEGGSSTGKTTALKLAASVWGSPAHHVRAWRVTDNGLESVCPLHNDNLLILDELGQVGGRALSEVAYMFANGVGKTRAARNGGMRAAASWRGVLLSSGELGLTAKLNEDGLQARAGQEVRFIGVPLRREHLSSLHGRAPGQLIHELSSLPFKHYGHAGREFLRRLTPRLDELSAGLGAALDEVEQRLCPAGADAQVRRVARRFALVCAGGTLAQDLDVLPDTLDIQTAVHACFADWLAERGSAGASEDAAILASVRLFIEQHGASRFQDIDSPEATCINRAGFKRQDSCGTEYIILPEAFKADVVRGYSPKRAAEALRAAGWLRVTDEKNSVRESLPGLGRVRCYVVSLPDETEPTM